MKQINLNLCISLHKYTLKISTGDVLGTWNTGHGLAFLSGRDGKANYA